MPARPIPTTASSHAAIHTATSAGAGAAIAAAAAQAAAAKAVARGKVHATFDGGFDLAIPGTEYRLRLLTSAPMAKQAGEKVAGVIRVKARRIDVVKSGGLFVEPVLARPRRIQGRIVALDKNADTLTIDVGAGPLVVSTDGRQHATDFEVGTLVACDVEAGATFTPGA